MMNAVLSKRLKITINIKKRVFIGKNMKILLVVPKYNLTNEIDYSYAIPTGLGYISAVLKKTGHDVDCLNLNHYSGTIADIVSKKLDEKNYDFVGTGNNALGYAVTEKIINAVKNHATRPKFILGGPIITSEPDAVFNLLNPDFAVIGEGEETIVELLEYIEKKEDLRKVKGIGFRDENGKILFTERRMPIENLDSIPWPDVDGLEFEKQLENLPGHGMYLYQSFDYPRPYAVLGSRGCPFNCTFCYHVGKYRQRTLDSIIKEIEYAVKRYEINIIVLYDDCFSIDKKRLYEFCKRMKKLREEMSCDLKWMPQLTVHNLDSEMLKTIKEAGGDTVSYGFESFSSEVLKSMKKPITPEMIEKAFYETMKAKIGIQANFIFGDVAETKETAYKTLNWWKKNCKGQVKLGFIQPYPGSEIYRHCLRKGIIKDKKEFIKNQVAMEHWYNMTDKMSDEEIRQLKRDILDAKSKYYAYTKPISIRNMGKERYELKVKCPFCGNVDLYGNCEIKNRYLCHYGLVCRDCHMLFRVMSLIKMIAYRYQPQLRAIRDLQLKILKFLKKSRM